MQMSRLSMLTDWMSQTGNREEKMIKLRLPDTSTKSSPQSEESIGDFESVYDESAPIIRPVQCHEQNRDFGAIFLADLYSNPEWENMIERPDFVSMEDVLTTGGGVNKTNYDGSRTHSLNKEKQTTTSSFTLPKSFCPVYSVRKEVQSPKSRHTALRVVEMYVNKDTPFEWTHEYREVDLGSMIEAYNSMARGMDITLHEDGVNFGGQINVNMNLSRPISVAQVPPSDCEAANTEKSTAKPTPVLTITSIILPQNTTEVINIDSKTTARKLIMNLFEKCRIVAHPTNYALYEYEQQIDETAGTLTRKLTRISDDACPLKVILNWPIPHCGRALVLMENRDSLEDDFEIPVHDNFERISGLESRQVDVKEKTNRRTGLCVTTYSKRNMFSKLLGDSVAERTVSIIFFSLAFIVGIVGLYQYLFTDEFSEQKQFEKKFPKLLVKEYLREFFEEFLQNRDLGTAASNRAIEL